MPVHEIKDQFNKIATNQLEKAMWGRSLVEAAHEGDIEQLCKALDNGADIDFQSDHDADLFANCLHLNGPYYLHSGLKDVAALQEFSQDKPNSRFHRCGSGNTALMRAVFYNHEDAVTLLLENGAKTHLQNSVGQDALYIAKMTENLKMQKMLAAEISRRATTLTRPAKFGRPLKYKINEDDTP